MKHSEFEDPLDNVALNSYNNEESDYYSWSLTSRVHISHTNFKNVALNGISQQPSHHLFYPSRLRHTQDITSQSLHNTAKVTKLATPPNPQD